MSKPRSPRCAHEHDRGIRLDGAVVRGDHRPVRWRDMKPRMKLRLVRAERPLAKLSQAEKLAQVMRDFDSDPWMRGEGAKFYTPARVAQIAADNDARRRSRK